VAEVLLELSDRSELRTDGGLTIFVIETVELECPGCKRTSNYQETFPKYTIYYHKNSNPCILLIEYDIKLSKLTREVSSSVLKELW